MNDNFLTKPIGFGGLFSSFWEKHSAFIQGVYTITFYLMSIYAFFKWLVILFETAREGNIAGFIVAFILSTIYQSFTALISTAIWGTIAIVVLFIPYLILRGFTK